MIPSKLKKGDEVRVISPASSLKVIVAEQRELAIERLNKMGLNVTFSKNSEEMDDFMSSSIRSRVDDIHEAFSDDNVKGILTTLGGYNSNQILRYMDYSLIKNNPKVLCGFSDITALSNAIYSKTNLVGYSGPHFSSFGMLKGIEYTMEHFENCLMQDEPYELTPSSYWSDDIWFMDQQNRKFRESRGFKTINPGEAEGVAIGGNLCTFNLLHGTEFMPDLTDKILFVEDDYETNPQTFDRDLQSIIHQPNFDKVRGLIIGRFERRSRFAADLLRKIITSKEELNNIPVLTDVDISHTTPRATIPIGGRMRMSASEEKAKIEVLEH
ncbi:S66 peptidase family protein [Proteinivorax hydrogeniformans]|uniref:S66 peptidase family protein n=1 Tax=Proteinivorax hydrogeniformans TaxID=1826727 RepID=A0AAU8HWZ4_9FIRM